MQTNLEGSESQVYGPPLYGLFEKAQIDGGATCQQSVSISKCYLGETAYFLSPTISWRSRADKIRIASEAAGAWPIIGHLLLGGSQLPGIFYKITVDLKLIF